MGAVCLRRAVRFAVRPGELDPEGRAGAGPALEADRAAVRLDDLARDREAEPRPGDAARRRVPAEELREDLRLVGQRDADAVVDDLEPQTVAAVVHDELDRAALRRVLDGVADQV